MGSCFPIQRVRFVFFVYNYKHSNFDLFLVKSMHLHLIIVNHFVWVRITPNGSCSSNISYGSHSGQGYCKTGQDLALATSPVTSMASRTTAS